MSDSDPATASVTPARPHTRRQPVVEPTLAVPTELAKRKKKDPVPVSSTSKTPTPPTVPAPQPVVVIEPLIDPPPIPALPLLPAMAEQYNNPSPTARGALSHRFVRRDLMERAVAAAATVRFSVKASRDAVIARLTELDLTPVSVNQRFPDIALVDLTRGTVSQNLYLLIAALDMGEREGDQRIHENDQKVQVMKLSHQILSDLYSADAVTQSVVGVFERAVFEEYYNLVWGAAR